jgi:DNA-binding GntR family transcriptional regulator
MTKGTLRDIGYRAIARALLLGELAPGRTMTIKELASHFGIGLSPTREATHLLASQGALEFLASGSVGVPRRSAEDLSDLFAARRLVEGKAAQLAVDHLRPRDMVTLRSLFARVERSMADNRPVDGLEANLDFHFTLYRASKSRYLVDIIERLWLGVGPLHAAPYLASPEERRVYTDIGSHKALLEAIETRDGDSVQTAIQSMLDHSLLWYIRCCTGEQGIFSPVASPARDLIGEFAGSGRRARGA